MNNVLLTKPQLASSEIPDIYTQVIYPKIMQPKLDGICCLAVEGVAMSRTMKPIPNRYVQGVFKKISLHGLHGELMVRGDFNDVQSAIMREDGEPNFYLSVYDKWDTSLPYKDRLKLIEKEVRDLGDKHIVLTHTFWVEDATDCENGLNTCLTAGYEGAMLRDPESLYKQGRHTLKSQALMKLKKFYDDEAVVIGFEEKLHNTNEKELDERGYTKRSSKNAGMVPANTLGALVVRWQDKEFKIGTGFNDEQRKYIWDNRLGLYGKLVTFKYQELSKYGVPRFPVWKCFREELNND